MSRPESYISSFLRLIVFIVAGCLAIYSQSDDIPLAIANVTSADRMVRYHAAAALCKANGDPRTTEPLLQLLNDPDIEIKGMIIRTMGFRKEVRAVSTLLELLNDPIQTTAAEAAEALGNIGDVRA